MPRDEAVEGLSECAGRSGDLQARGVVLTATQPRPSPPGCCPRLSDVCFWIFPKPSPKSVNVALRVSVPPTWLGFAHLAREARPPGGTPALSSPRYELLDMDATLQNNAGNRHGMDRVDRRGLTSAQEQALSLERS